MRPGTLTLERCLGPLRTLGFSIRHLFESFKRINAAEGAGAGALFILSTNIRLHPTLAARLTLQPSDEILEFMELRNQDGTFHNNLQINCYKIANDLANDNEASISLVDLGIPETESPLYRQFVAKFRIMQTLSENEIADDYFRIFYGPDNNLFPHLLNSFKFEILRWMSSNNGIPLNTEEAYRICLDGAHP